ncbi:MAG: sulfatase [Bryobacterales bacterium]|nr:sulfatase [Bryobacterales bacterium]
MTRRQFCSGAGLALHGCSKPPSRPNLLLVVADDMSYPHAGAYGDKAVSTPAFDRIAQEGVIFHNSFCASPSCTPSRTAILSGKNIWQTGEAGLLYGSIPPDLRLFPHILEDAGYFTGYTGKGWGPGDWQALGLKRSPTGREFNSRLISLPGPQGIDTRDYADNFGHFLSECPQQQPFFFWMGITEPHRLYAKGAGLAEGKRLQDVTLPAYYPDSEEIRSDFLDYYMEIEWLDLHLARTLAILHRTGRLEDTLVLVTSDNGHPFPRAKVNLYDGGLHMPMAMRWGRRFAGKREARKFVQHIDIAPTLLEAAGIRPPVDMAGRSFLSLEGGERAIAAMERHTYCRPDGATYPMRSLRNSDYLYIRNFAPDRWPTGGPDFVSSNKTFHGDVDGCPTKDFLLAPGNQRQYAREYELCFGKRPAEELYDVRADRWQVNNLAASPQHQSTLQNMRSELETYLRQTGDPRIEGRDPWQSYAYRQTTGFGASFNSALPEQERQKARERATHKPE